MKKQKNKTKFNLGNKWLRLIALLLFGGAISYFALVKANLLMPLSEIPEVFCLLSCEPEEAFHPAIEGDDFLNYEQALEQVINENFAQGEISILVEKAKLRLTVFQDRQPMKSYPIVLGSAPEGDKFHEGDRKTPEGIYYVRDLYPHSAWFKFIWLDYPRPESWREHFQAKLSGETN
ncbi:ErfK/YbiS/YcfS/YnhG family protein [[Leptolyngbya] sp. PCC 7376]|uniref:L,D-transpeptidase family protein n=1 Tax=[Leptolyngbya] sp. PCC 7376 TaxID=111781 RepID=UPI00029ED141|nr:L,D-transpeptidase family protein [[Leptolyngbya] sp. PCC 7376]AFY40163.1 ErfK/YbiS/YcfS/YnhG family protein [[Leptolyngbya] sp. PCC 7376]